MVGVPALDRGVERGLLHAAELNRICRPISLPLILSLSLSVPLSQFLVGHQSDLSGIRSQSTPLLGSQQLHNGFPACASVH